MTREVINELKKYTLGRQNTEKVDISVLQLNRVIKALEQEPTTERIEYGIDGNPYVLSMTNGKELEQAPCEDAISRQAVIKTLDDMDNVLDEDRTIENYKELLKECYKVLPPVTPQPNKEDIHREREQAYMRGYEDGSRKYRTEQSEDAISRQAVLDLAKKGVLISNDSYKSVSRFIYDLPSVNHVKINDIYPLTIIRDRYNDVYSGGKYLAFNLDADEIPTEIWGDDVECREFFYEVEQGRNDILIGKGHTIGEAVINLQEKMNE